MALDPEAALASLRTLHEAIDREVDLLNEEHAERLRCGPGCSACCLDGLTVEAVEAERICRAHPDLLRDTEPHPIGACAFLDGEGSCRVYADRPSLCRSQGLPLRFLLEDEHDEVVERRDICPLNLEGGPPLEELVEEACWLLGPAELRLAAIADAFSTEGKRERVALRGLFERDRPSNRESR
ncbi:MAG: YkgJ family cysteine cluster protein [bacterium]|nr:YkgJ family cysteine cluster protein [bacterium]